MTAQSIEGEYDYVIVGAGSAGCAVAERLTRDGRTRVALLEAGPDDWSPWIKIPLGYGKLFHDPAYNWRYESQADPGTENRPSYWPRGKVVGGSSSINAMVYFRGLPNDFDDWAAAGNPGWAWQDVRPVYEQIEQRFDADGAVHGDGPVAVSRIDRDAHATIRYFKDAAAELGLKQTASFNGADPEGVGLYETNTRKGWRWSAADAFLRRARKRPNLRVLTHARATRLICSERRVTGVEFLRGRSLRQIAAGREVIVSCGAVNTPQLLQTSGIGPVHVLRNHGIDVQLANANVGNHLQDHLAVNYYFRANEPTLNNILGTWTGLTSSFLRFVAQRRGPLAMSINQGGGFVRSRPDAPAPDMQLYFNPLTYTSETAGKRRLTRPDSEPGFILSFQPCRPTSRGRIEIANWDPLAAPLIFPNYLSTNQDIADVINGGRLIARFAASDAIRKLTAHRLDPDITSLDDEAILADFRKRCGTVFHPVGTCRMGKDETSSVVDPELRVHGMEGLRIVDASVFPNITSGNTNAPSMMLGVRAGDIIARG